MNSLKYLPWRSLFLAAFLSVTVVKAADLMLGWTLSHLSSAEVLIKLLLTKPGFTLMYLCAGLAIGSLGVIFFKQLGNDSALYSSTLWALGGCLLISLWLVLHLDVGGLSLVKIHYIHTIGIIVGVFWKGQHPRR